LKHQRRRAGRRGRDTAGIGAESPKTFAHHRAHVNPPARQMSMDEALGRLQERCAVLEAERVLRSSHSSVGGDVDVIFAEFSREYLAQHGATPERELLSMWAPYFEGYIQALLDDGHRRGEFKFERDPSGVRMWSLPR
jgi:hypothetical protein